MIIFGVFLTGKLSPLFKQSPASIVSGIVGIICYAIYIPRPRIVLFLIDSNQLSLRLDKVSEFIDLWIQYINTDIIQKIIVGVALHE